MSRDKTAFDFIHEAATRIHAAYRAAQAGDIPLTQDRLDEAYYSIVQARAATGPDHHRRKNHGAHEAGRR